MHQFNNEKLLCIQIMIRSTSYAREDWQFGIYILWAPYSGLTGKAFNHCGPAYQTGKKHCGCLKVHYPLIALCSMVYIGIF